jgi:hypothetical protein
MIDKIHGRRPAFVLFGGPPEPVPDGIPFSVIGDYLCREPHGDIQIHGIGVKTEEITSRIAAGF